MRQSNLLIFNTVVTYVRMAMTIVITLVVTRLLLRILGSADYGLLMLFGATGLLLDIVSQALTASAQRHLAYELGRGDNQRLRDVFNTTLGIFLATGVLIVAVGTALAPLVLSVLNIPPGRETAAFWVYELTLAGLAVVMAEIPFRSVVEAHQALIITAIRHLVTIILRLAIVLVLLLMTGDQLILYAVLLLGVYVFSLATFATVVMLMFAESRPEPGRFRRSQVRGLLSFAGWATVAQLGWRLRMQGGAVLLNVCFGGTLLNAAYGLAQQVVGAQLNLGSAIFVAARPAAIRMYAQDRSDDLKRIVFLACKYPVLAMLFFLVPVVLNTETLLDLWLGQYPPFTTEFVCLAMIWMTVLQSTRGYHLAMLARGDLARYTLIMVIPDVGVLVLAAAAFGIFRESPWAPLALPFVTLMLTVLQIGLQSWYVGRKIDLPVRRWLWDVARPVTIVLLIAGSAAWAARELFEPGVPRLIATGLAYLVMACPVIWLVAMAEWERHQFLRSLRSLGQTLRRRPTDGQ